MFLIKFKFTTTQKVRYYSSSTGIETQVFNLAEVSTDDVLKFLNGKSGIYKWTNKLNGKSYVGSSIDLNRRITEYFNAKRSLRELNRGESILYSSLIKYPPLMVRTSRLQRLAPIHQRSARAVDRRSTVLGVYGDGYINFTLEILEVLNVDGQNTTESRSILLDREQYYIDLLNPELNILKKAGSNLGKKMSVEARSKMSEAKLGKPSHRKGLKGLEAFTKESLQKMSDNSGMKKLVYVYSLDHVLLFPPFHSIKSCASSLELSRYKISRALDKDKVVEKYIFASNIQETWNNSIL